MTFMKWLLGTLVVAAVAFFGLRYVIIQSYDAGFYDGIQHVMKYKYHDAPSTKGDVQT